MANMQTQLVKTYSHLAVALLIVSALAPASTQAFEFKPVAGIGWDFYGGDLLVSGTSPECGDTNVKANNGYTLNAGGVMIADSFETQATLGYKYASPAAETGSIVWDAMPLELIQFYRTSLLRMGLGFSYHINPKLVVDVPGLSYANYYDNALGAVVQIGWAPVQKSYSIDLRYTAINYKQKDASIADEKSGSVLGIYSSYYF